MRQARRDACPPTQRNINVLPWSQMEHVLATTIFMAPDSSPRRHQQAYRTAPRVSNVRASLQPIAVPQLPSGGYMGPDADSYVVNGPMHQSPSTTGSAGLQGGIEAHYPSVGHNPYAQVLPSYPGFVDQQQSYGHRHQYIVQPEFLPQLQNAQQVPYYDLQGSQNAQFIPTMEHNTGGAVPMPYVERSLSNGAPIIITDDPKVDEQPNNITTPVGIPVDMMSQSVADQPKIETEEEALQELNQLLAEASDRYSSVTCGDVQVRYDTSTPSSESTDDEVTLDTDALQYTGDETPCTSQFLCDNEPFGIAEQGASSPPVEIPVTGCYANGMTQPSQDNGEDVTEEECRTTVDEIKETNSQEDMFDINLSEARVMFQESYRGMDIDDVIDGYFTMKNPDGPTVENDIVEILKDSEFSGLFESHYYDEEIPQKVVAVDNAFSQVPHPMVSQKVAEYCTVNMGTTRQMKRRSQRPLTVTATQTCVYNVQVPTSLMTSGHLTSTYVANTNELESVRFSELKVPEHRVPGRGCKVNGLAVLLRAGRKRSLSHDESDEGSEDEHERQSSKRIKLIMDSWLDPAYASNDVTARPY